MRVDLILTDLVIFIVIYNFPNFSRQYKRE
jgi:hypothetical protein